MSKDLQIYFLEYLLLSIFSFGFRLKSANLIIWKAE